MLNISQNVAGPPALAVRPDSTPAPTGDPESDAACAAAAKPGADPWPSIGRDVLSILGALGTATGVSLAGAPLLGCALALGGAISALLRWGPSCAQERQAAFAELVAELEASGVARTDIDRLTSLARDAAGPAEIFHAIFPEVSREAFRKWLKGVEALDTHRRLDFGRIVIALRARLNASPLTPADDVLRALPVRDWVRAANDQASRLPGLPQFGDPTPLSIVIREALTWMYGDFRASTVDPLAVRTARAEHNAIANHDAAQWLALNDTRSLDADAAGTALSAWQARQAQAVLSARKAALLDQKASLKAGTQSRQLDRHIRAIDLSHAMLMEPNEEKRAVMRRELAGVKDAIATWSLPRAARVARQKQERGELPPFEPPTIPPPRCRVPSRPDNSSSVHEVRDARTQDERGAPHTMAHSAGARHGGVLQSVPRVLGRVAHGLNAAVSTLVSWGRNHREPHEEGVDIPLNTVTTHDPQAPEAAVQSATGVSAHLMGTALGLSGAGSVVYLGREWMRAASRRLQATDASQSRDGDGSLVPTVTPSQQHLVERLARTVHAGAEGVWGSTLDAIADVVSAAADPHAPETVRQVSAILLRDLGEIPVIDADADAERPAGSAASPHPAGTHAAPGTDASQRILARRKRDTLSVAAAAPTTERVAHVQTAQTTQTTQASGADHTVTAIIDTVDRYEHSSLASDEAFLFEAMQARWRSDPALDWLARAPESEQKLWLHYVQAAGDRFGQFSQALDETQPRDGFAVAFASAGLDGSPESWTVGYPASGHATGEPVMVRRSLIDACLCGDPDLDPDTFEGFVNGVRVDAEQERCMRALLRDERCRTTPQARLDAARSQIPALQGRFAAFLEAELYRDILEAKLKGHLTGGSHAWVRGLTLIEQALRGAPGIEIGELHLDAPGVSRPVPLLPWLVFTRKEGDGDSCVVLYRPNDKAWTVFGNRRELFQYLDLTRMNQALVGEMAPSTVQTGTETPKSFPQVALEAAAPGERRALRQFFDVQSENPVNWKSDYLRFAPYEGDGLGPRVEQWAQRQLERLSVSLDTLAKAPKLPAQLADALALEQKFSEFEGTHLPPIREFTRRIESGKLTRALKANGLPELQKADANEVSIAFNGKNMTLTDWVLEGYRQYGDNALAPTNNFLRDARITAKDPEIARVLGTASFRESLERNLRTTYAGDAYIAHMRAWIGSDDSQAQSLRRLNEASTHAQLRLTLSQEIANGRIDKTDAVWMSALIEGLPDRTSNGNAALGELHVARCRIPGVLTLSRRWRRSDDPAGQAIRQDFVWLPHGPYGSELMPLSEYRAQLHRPPYDDDLRSRALVRDRETIDDALRHSDGVSVSEFGAPVLDSFARFCEQRLRDKIDDAQESTTGRSEMIWSQIVAGVRMAALPVCIVPAGGAGLILCGLGTAVLVGEDLKNAYWNIQRGKFADALLDVAFLWADFMDVAAGLKVLDPRRLLAWARKARFSSAAEVTQAIDAIQYQRAAFDGKGRLDGRLAQHGVDVEHAWPIPVGTGPRNAGVRYERDGRSYIRDGGQTFEVFSQNGWATVRVRDPLQPNGAGIPVVFRDGKWRWDDAGLLGGAPQLRGNRGTNDPVVRLMELGLSPADAQTFLKAFVFPRDAAAARRQDLVQALYSTGKIPPMFFPYARSFERGSIFGWTGQTPAEVLGSRAVRVDPSLQRYREQFDFPKAAMWAWFDQEMATGVRPVWAAAYAKTLDDMFTAEEILLAKGVFRSAEEARWYLAAFNLPDAARRRELIEGKLNGRTPPSLYRYLRPSDMWIVLRKEGLTAEQVLGASHVFPNEAEVKQYLDKFEFPSTAFDGKGREWLAQRRLVLGSTPLDFLEYLRTPIDVNASPAKMLVTAGLFPNQREAKAYLDNFSPQNFGRAGRLSQEEARKIALARILEGAPPSWAFRFVEPEAVIRLYGPDRIPFDIETLSVVEHTGARLTLPEAMPNLRTLRITGPVDLTLPRDMPDVTTFSIKSARLPEAFALPPMRRVTAISIDGTNVNSIRIPADCRELRGLSINNNDALHTVAIASASPGTPDAGPLPMQSIAITANPRLQRIDLPVDMSALDSLTLTHNDLTRVPLSPDHRLTGLWLLDLSDNRIATMSDLPQMPLLRYLRLTNNELSRVPTALENVRGIAQAGVQRPLLSVDLSRNPIPEEAVADWTRRGARATDFRLDFSMPGVSGRQRALEDAVADWFEPSLQAARKEMWQRFADEDNADDFSAFLDRLRRTVNYESEAFRTKVTHWVRRLETDEVLRKDTFPLSLCATETCEDRVTWTYGQMKQRLLAADVANGAYDNDPAALETTMRGLFRLAELEDIARAKVATMTYVDEVEVYLGYQVKLREPLKLPIDAEDMRFFGVAGLTPDDLDAARVMVLDREAQRFPSYLSNSGPIQEALRRRWPEAFDAATDKLAQSADPDAFRARAQERLKGTGLENDDDALREVGPDVQRDLVHEAYGPLVQRLFAKG
ncbi:hypothetical protein AB870_10565 [Pandoraea faecigallinarum]|uniref:NEL domain-containing protein n=1 Tax=Pandoraea faecigallinarum TaxID=656179 RepID=A0A0H3WV87_9BURK|nr:NEL-type E3 ubiquitin ligase domain-containing protein [Pandoraea faecigallinarum]AKM30451.1 hypothetical protein AB870_10565 [Pandoraea faecigallinarum]